jgi:hypothetical protein
LSIFFDLQKKLNLQSREGYKEEGADNVDTTPIEKQNSFHTMSALEISQEYPKFIAQLIPKFLRWKLKVFGWGLCKIIFLLLSLIHLQNQSTFYYLCPFQFVFNL